MSEVEAEGAEPVGGEATPEWAGPDQETWEQTQAEIAELRQAAEYLTQQVQPVWQQQQQQQEPVQLDPLADDFQERLDQYIEQKNAPYQEYVQAQQFREGEARAQDILADDIAKNGEFIFNDPKSPMGDSKSKARALANNYIGDMNQQFPRDPAKAAEAALAKAAQDVRDWETAVGKAYHEQQINQLGQLSGARRDQGVGTNGTQFQVPAGGTLIDVAYRHGEGR